ncbi:MAG: hypothetical protein ACJ8AD_09585 [Gemmatimonadaceae bacterium]
MQRPFGSSADPLGAGFRSKARAALGDLAAPEWWQTHLRDLIALVESSMQHGVPAPPAPQIPPRDQPLGYTLEDAAITSADAVEAFARGALANGHDAESILAWAHRRADHPSGSDAAAAAAVAVLRERGYAPLIAWASEKDDAPPVRAVAPPAGVHEGLFSVPRRPYVVGQAIARRFAHDYPYTTPALKPLHPVGGDKTTFRPELVPALAQEQSFMSSMSKMTTQEYEDVILPLSRIPGLNALVLAALLLDDILTPMEILGWIGVDIHNLPRDTPPDRPVAIDVLPAPTPGAPGIAPVKYMMFSDTHRDAPQDVTFRIDHFSDNQALYLRALEWCDTEGYTVIENGDCEELWYEPTFDPALRQTKLQRLQDIFQLHQPVYQKLASLAAAGRHVRSIGNHDSYLWEDPTVVAWRQANFPAFPDIRGGFVIPSVKPMDDFLPHIGLDAGAYTQTAEMLVIHGHHFDFWNCDEHNRLGKFITNAVAVPLDAFDNIIFDYRGIDRLGHPMIEFWDVLDRYTPWNCWPAHDVAREWAQALAYRPLTNSLTQDSIVFSETLAAVMCYLMRTGPIDPFNFGVLLCIGHTHNPQSRPWIPYLSGYNPWRTYELFGERVFENLFAIKTRYFNSGTVGWWQDVIWATEITANGQPRLVYWCNEDMTPVTMDWELDDEGPTPGNPLPALEDWATQFLAAELERRLSMATASASTAGDIMALSPPGGIASVAGTGSGAGPAAPLQQNLGRLERMLASTTPLPFSLASPSIPRDRVTLAALTLAARQNPAFGGADPRSWPATVALGDAGPSVQSSPLGRLLWPSLLAGARPDSNTSVDIVALLRALFVSFTPAAASPSRMGPRPTTSRAR